jgi:hypothetical protein
MGMLTRSVLIVKWVIIRSRQARQSAAVARRIRLRKTPAAIALMTACARPDNILMTVLVLVHHVLLVRSRTTSAINRVNSVPWVNTNMRQEVQHAFHVTPKQLRHREAHRKQIVCAMLANTWTVLNAHRVLWAHSKKELVTKHVHDVGVQASQTCTAMMPCQ